MMKYNYLLIIYVLIKYSTTQDVLLNDETPLNVKLFDLKNLFSNSGTTFKLLAMYKAHKYFTIKNDHLYTNSLIDMDSMCDKAEICCDKDKESCDFDLGIACKESQETVNLKTLKINIRDKNDNTPRFDKKNLEMELPETIKVGYTISLPVANDDDFGTNRVESYRIDRQEPGNFEEYFRLVTDKQSRSTKASLKLLKQLDRERLNKYSFNLLAIDGAYNDPKTGSINIIIKISDENDNAPQFSKSVYKESVKEGFDSQSPIVLLSANDPDENSNGKILYRFDPIHKNDPIILENFVINEETGEILLRQKLDYEKQKSFKFNVIAINPTPFSTNSLQTSTATVEITVINVYDEQLIITVDYLSDRNYSVVEENKNGAFVALVTAQTKEANHIQGSIQCSLENFHETLHLISKNEMDYTKKSYEIRTIREIDREMLPKITTKVKCSEKMDSIDSSSYATIEILIKDQNDNAPSLTISGDKSVRENSPIGKTVLIIKAEDKDEAENGRVTFSMDKSSHQSLEYLMIGETDGIIKIKSLIDCETNNGQLTSLSVTITATDHGNPQKSTDIQFNIDVIDVNDNVPKFVSNPMLFTIMENNPKYVYVGEIEVEDRDYGDNIYLELSNQNPVQLPFKIWQKSKRIFHLNTTRSLDRERESKFNFKVLASDGRGYSAHTITGTVEVEVLDDNDNFPVIIFPPQNNASSHIISYLEPKNYKFMTVSANDQDQTPESNTLEFSLEGTIDIFDIDKQEGSIYTRRDMTSKDVGDHKIVIVVSNTGNSKIKSSVSININIDKSPPKSKVGRHESENNNLINNSNPLLPGSYNISDIIIVILIVIVVFVVFIVVCFVCLGLRHYNKDPICLRSVLDKCFHSDISQAENNVYIPPLNNNSKTDLDYYKDLQQKPAFRREQSDNWGQLNHLDTYNIAINPPYFKQTYTKLLNQSQYYGHHPPTYQTIDDSFLNKFPDSSKTILSLHQRKTFEPNYKSEMNLNTENLFCDQNQELCQINEQAKVQWLASLTPMPTRSKSVINRVIPSEQIENNFAVVYPQEQSTFV